MKKLLFRAIPAMALSAALAVSCQKEQEGGENTVPVFPEPVTEYVAPGETVEIAFSANMDWTASIPAEDAAEYFRIIDGSQEAYNVRGKAGDAVITIKCNGTQDFENHSVDLSLTMGGQTEVIASVILPSLERKFGLKTADLNEDGSGFVASSDGKFDWTYTGSDVADGGDINMVWVNEDKAYRIYVLADANFGYTVTVPEGVSYKAGKTSGTGIEYSFTVSDINTGDEALVHGISFTAKDDETETHSFNLNVPPFEAEFSVYPVIADENGYAYDETGLGFTWGYEEEPVAEGGDITLIWPEGQMGYGFHILVDANFEYTVEKPDWLAMTERNTVGTVKEYDFSVDASDYSLDGISEDFVFMMKGTEEKYSYKVVLPACKGIFRSTVPLEVEFNADGDYKDANGTFVSIGATGSLTTAGEPVFYAFGMNEGGYYMSNEYYSSWIAYTYSWPSLTDAVAMSNDITIKLSSTDKARTGLLMALPAYMAEEITDPDTQLIDDSGKAVRPEYADYVISYITQTEPVSEWGVITPEDYEYWSYEGAYFDVLDSSDPLVSSFGCEYNYRIKQTASGLDFYGAYNYFSISRPFDGYRVYENGEQVTELEGYWAELVKDQWSDSYTLVMTPGEGVTSRDAYYVFYDGEGDFAVMYCVYDQGAGEEGGSEYDVKFSYPESAASNDNSTLVELTSDDPLYADYAEYGVPVYHLTYTKENTPMSMIEGLPTGMAVPNAEWLSIEPGEGYYTVRMNAATAFGDTGTKTATSYIMFYDASWNTALILVCTLDLSGTSSN